MAMTAEFDCHRQSPTQEADEERLSYSETDVLLASWSSDDEGSQELQTCASGKVKAALAVAAVASGVIGMLGSKLLSQPIVSHTAQERLMSYERGTVSAVYTYGAPATATPPLKNLLAKDGCFEGLRAYTEDSLGLGTKQDDAAAMSNLLSHAKMSSAILHRGADSIFYPCPGEPSQPNANNGRTITTWDLHWESDYVPRLREIAIGGINKSHVEPFKSSGAFALFAYKSYDSAENTREALAAQTPDWKLVAQETRVEGVAGFYDEDPVSLMQNEESLDCALVFAGTNNLENEISTSTSSSGVEYCGFRGVHNGYHEELRKITRDIWPRLRPKLSMCRSVSCVGHSLGGSLCEIFSACANSNRVSDPDFERQMWLKGKYQPIPGITNGSVAWLDGAEHRCERPPCPKR